MDPGDPSSYRLILGGSGSMFSICVTLEKQTRLQLTWHQWHHQNSPNFFLGTPDRFQLSSKILKPEETTVGKIFWGGGCFFPRSFLLQNGEKLYRLTTQQLTQSEHRVGQPLLRDYRFVREAFRVRYFSGVLGPGLVDGHRFHLISFSFLHLGRVWRFPGRIIRKGFWEMLNIGRFVWLIWEFLCWLEKIGVWTLLIWNTFCYIVIWWCEYGWICNWIIPGLCMVALVGSFHCVINVPFWSTFHFRSTLMDNEHQ